MACTRPIRAPALRCPAGRAEDAFEGRTNRGCRPARRPRPGGSSRGLRWPHDVASTQITEAFVGRLVIVFRRHTRTANLRRHETDDLPSLSSASRQPRFPLGTWAELRVPRHFFRPEQETRTSTRMWPVSELLPGVAGVRHVLSRRRGAAAPAGRRDRPYPACRSTATRLLARLPASQRIPTPKRQGGGRGVHAWLVGQARYLQTPR